MKNIVIVGGGTAGWITALYAKKSYPNDQIVLVESEEIGILGAGEGSTNSLVEMLELLDINIIDLIRKCNIGIKNGIKFSGWSDSSDAYFHPFGSNNSASNDYNFSLNFGIESDTSFSHMIGANNNNSLLDYSFVQKFSDKNKVPFVSPSDAYSYGFTYNPFSQIGIHFDARLLAKYLREIGELRGVIRKEGTVEEIITDSDGFIVKLLTNTSSIDTDFVFDCTGFKRLIIGKFYKSPWKSHSDHLPVNSAIPFFLPRTEKIPPYTESIAMNYGWMWNIPLQNRYGCGYTFDSNQISEEDAKKEIDSFIGFEVESPKTFKFNAGYYKEIWIKNCLAVGLSTGFIEPLEATSLWQATRNLIYFFSSYNNINMRDENNKKKFNERFCSDTEEVVNFLYMHYITDKKNTKFWENFNKDNTPPEFSEYVLSVIKERPLDISDFFDKRMFPIASYYYILVGNNILSKEKLIEHFKMLKTDKNQEYMNIVNSQNDTISHLIDHNYFLKSFNNNLT